VAAATVLSAGAGVASAQILAPPPGTSPGVVEPPAPPATVTAPTTPTAPTVPTTSIAPTVDTAPAGEDLAELARLSEEAGALGEELHQARSDLDRAVAERDRREREAGVAVARALAADVDASRDQSLVDRLATMRYRGGDTGATRAAVLADSPRDLVDRLGTLQRLSGTTTSALDASRAASVEAARLRLDAEAASELARVSARDAQNRSDEIDRRTDEMRARIDEVRTRVDALSDTQRRLWAGGPLVPPGYVAPPADGVNSAALNVALTRLGAPYSWGATGPSEFDCSGLMVWSYAREGKTLPRSSQAQAVSGAPVAMADIQPGDLVIYFPEATHVGMYAGDGLVLHAPTYGVPVKLEKVDAMPVSAIRRY
jgi:cell wall-associated NlpC family hydrolase